jgi:hypothetical protein
MAASEPPGRADLDPVPSERLAALIEEGSEIFRRFDREVRGQRWHSFVAADYEGVLRALIPLRGPGLRFLEWGSATGVITIMADLLGFEACGIELDGALVDVSRSLAEKYESDARFVAGSFLPEGYAWTPDTGDGRQGTIGHGPPGYAELGRRLDDFDVVFAYPWSGEEPMMHDILRRHGRHGARLLIHGNNEGVKIYTNEAG